MKRSVMLLIAAFAAVLAGCSFSPPIVGSGRAITTATTAPGVTRVSASQACDLSIVRDTTYGVQVTCDDNLVDYLSVGTDAFGTLRIGLDPAHSYTGITFRAVVHVPSLEGLDLSGASQATVDAGFSSAQPLSVTLSGASSATLAGITCGGVTATVSGASTLNASGPVDSASLTVSGASTVDMLGCTMSAATVNLSGASRGKVTIASGLVTLSASGASTFSYRGAPTLNIVELSGGSSITYAY